MALNLLHDNVANNATGKWRANKEECSVWCEAGACEVKRGSVVMKALSAAEGSVFTVGMGTVLSVTATSAGTTVEGHGLEPYVEPS